MAVRNVNVVDAQARYEAAREVSGKAMHNVIHVGWRDLKEAEKEYAADLKEGMSILEPSAGMGHIADQISENGFNPDVIEISNS